MQEGESNQAGTLIEKHITLVYFMGRSLSWAYYDQDVLPHVTSEDAEHETVSGFMISRDMYNQLGAPTTLTITVESGDRLN